MNFPNTPTSLTPMMPPINHALPLTIMNRSIEEYGVRLKWLSSSQCPCMYGGSVPGSPDHKCLSCFGRGVIWTNPGPLFTGLITYERFGSKPPGSENDPQWGSLLSADPNLTIPSTQEAMAVWENASMYDAYVEIDASMRFYTPLSVGGINVVPYQHSLSIEPTGAVAVWNTQTKSREFISDYTVNGPSVIISGYPEGTSYTVEFTASPVYVAYNKAGGMPHVRPFGNGVAGYPKRFKIKLLDLWLRENTSNTAV
jgi:hypothetical protein